MSKAKGMRRVLVSSLVLFAVVLLTASVSFGGTVTNTLDDGSVGSLREVIQNTAPGGTVDFAVAGTIMLTMGEILIDKDLTITGPGADMVTIDAQTDSRIFNLDDGSPLDVVVSISGLRFINGSEGLGGGAIRNTEQLSIDSCVFENNSAGFGGAILFVDTTSGEITNSTFSGNNANMDGGAIHNIQGTIGRIANCTFINNSADNDGGAINNDFIIQEITNSTFTGNSALDDGGGINNDTDATIVQITNSTFTGNSAMDTGGAILNLGDMSISFTTIANNSALSQGGGIFQGISMPPTDIRNTIVAFNMAGAGNNCNADIADEAGDETNNYSDDSTCGFGAGGDNATIMLDVLADNGGPTETMALLGGDPLEGATADCDAIHDLGVPVQNDQRNFPRPFGAFCDAGAYEAGTASVNITKVTIPPGGTGYSFSSIGFTDLSCGITDAFMLDDMQTASCDVPSGDYTVDEDIPVDQVLFILCDELPDGSTVDNANGSVMFTVAEEVDNVDCLFINSFANTLVRVTDEPEGANCEFGGSLIETGLDTNQNGVLDDAEVADMFYVCNGAPGALVNITDEPEGANCEFGGQKIETGIDDNGNGVLEDAEVDDFAYVCNGAPGVDTLVDITEEPAGANCGFGGQRIDAGPDTNQNGVLDDAEVDYTEYICNGEPGPEGPQGPEGDQGDQGPQGPPGDDGQDGADAVSDINLLPAGDECPQGGISVSTGTDDNGNGVLDPEEVDSTEIVCNGENGTNGGCAIAGSGGAGGGLPGLLLYSLIPAAIVLRRRLRKSRNK